VRDRQESGTDRVMKIAAHRLEIAPRTLETGRAAGRNGRGAPRL